MTRRPFQAGQRAAVIVAIDAAQASAMDIGNDLGPDPLGLADHNRISTFLDIIQV
jgi:hypothetical protein